MSFIVIYNHLISLFIYNKSILLLVTIIWYIIGNYNLYIIYKYINIFI